MKKWSPWPAMATRKFNVKVKLVLLEFVGFCNEEGDIADKKEKVMAIRMKWKGEPKFGLVPFHRKSKRRKEISTEKIVKRGDVSVVLDDEFENICSFTFVSGNDHKFGPWEISFGILSGEKMEQKAKLGVIGRVSLNIAEMASMMMMMMDSQFERKLPLTLHIGGAAIEANLLVSLNFIEIRDSKDSEGINQNSVQSTGDMNVGELKLENLVEPPESSSSTLEIENADETSSDTETGGLSTSSETQLESVKKVGFFSWKRRRLSFRPSSLDKKTSGCNTDSNNNNNNRTDMDLQTTTSSTVDLVTSSPVQEVIGEGAWESKEFVSRDGKSKLKTNVFFASFDQCSNKAAGESACTALVAVIAHWLQLNRDAMPTRSEFNNLIVEGSYEWRKLCKNDAYTNDFPNKHFDLETVLHADVRPISISRDDSFIGFFSPEKFESLKEAMSFDEIWSDINKMTEDDDSRIYIVSWNDHFFVLKVEADACYIIDTLGERLYEGCNQAYILKFDHSSLVYGKTDQKEGEKAEVPGRMEKTNNPNGDEEMIICNRGKECCREFMKRFLAAIPLQELEAEEKKRAVSYYSLHHRLQIELNFSYLLSSLTSSPFSTSSNCCASSWSSTDESCI